MSNLIQWFPADRPLSSTRQQYFKEQNFRLSPYTQDADKQPAAVLLQTPILCEEDTWVAPETVWKTYWAAQNPALRLLQCGIDNSAPTRNYLHWNRLPEHLDDFLSNAAAATDWMPHPGSGTPLGTLWAKFRDGHDKGGFMDWFIAIRRRIKMVASKLEVDRSWHDQGMEVLSQPTTLESFENLVKRWQRYQPILATSPCLREIETIDAHIAFISEGWAYCRTPETLLTRLKQIDNAFTEINTQIEQMNTWF